MDGLLALRLAYGANIVILVPVCWAMFSGRLDAVFQGAVPPSDGLRLLVGSLWLAILLASAAGLAVPRFFAPVLLVQIVYKAIWLAVFVAPLIRAGAPNVPWGIAATFAGIVLVWPFLFAIGMRD